jgi:hypothetical protein
MPITFGSPEALRIVSESKKTGETITYHYENGSSETHYHRTDGSIERIGLILVQPKPEPTEETKETD